MFTRAEKKRGDDYHRAATEGEVDTGASDAATADSGGGEALVSFAGGPSERTALSPAASH